MEPLKRFTQCGSLTMLFTVFIILFGVSSTALTTFGKSPNPPAPPPTPPPVKARECSAHSDCTSLQHTSCVRDGSSTITRCLCGNSQAPVNGQCDTKAKKNLRHLCSNSEECAEEMICSVDNSTKTTGFTKNSNPSQKICLCYEENGFTEDKEDNICNDAGRLFAGVLVPLISIVLGIIITSKRQSIY